MTDLATDLRRYGDALEDLMMAKTPRVEEHRPHRRRGWFVAGAAAIVVAAIAGGFWFTNRDSSRGLPISTEPPPKLSVLDRAPTARDVLPPGFGVDPATARSLRRALAVPGWQIFIGRGVNPGDDYCMEIVSVADTDSSRAGSSGTSCGDLSSLARDGVHVMGSEDDAHHSTFFGVVPDGTEAVTVAGSQAVLGENAFIATDIDWTGPLDIRIKSKTGTRVFVLPAPRERPRSTTTTP